MGNQFCNAAPAASTETGSTAASKVSTSINAELRHVMGFIRMPHQRQVADRVALNKVDQVAIGHMRGSALQVSAGRNFACP